MTVFVVRKSLQVMARLREQVLRKSTQVVAQTRVNFYHLVLGQSLMQSTLKAIVNCIFRTALQLERLFYSISTVRVMTMLAI